MSPPRQRLLGLPVDALSMEDAVSEVAALARAEPGRRVVVMNANKAWQARRDDRLRRSIESADLLIAEYAMTWAAGMLGRSGVAHVGGLTLMVRLLDEAERRGWSIYLLGARAEVCGALAGRLRRERPALRIAGHHHGYLDGASEARVRAELRERRPELVFVAMGSPLQEYTMEMLAEDAGARVMMGVGGSFDVLAGHKRDAPRWMRGRGLEWIYRLVQDPRRMWRRYLVTNTWFVGAVLRERLLGPPADGR